jgi:sortase B
VGNLKRIDRLALAILTISIFAMVFRFYDYEASRKTMEKARAEYYSDESCQVSGKSMPEGEKFGEALIESDMAILNTGLTDLVIEESKINRDKYDDIRSLNDDFVGWLKIPDTPIDYPVVRGNDNEFYLKHGFDSKKNVSGAIFMDYRNGMEEDKNVIIYGHNMKNGTMFKGLMNYKNRDFFNEHRIVSFDTGKEKSRWKIFSVYVTDTGFNYIETHFSNGTFQEFVDKVGRKSIYDTAENLDEINEILTLSTCSYEFDDARFVVHAARIDFVGARGTR